MGSRPSAASGALPPALGRMRVALQDAFERAARELALTTQQAELLCAAINPAPIGDLARRLRCDRSNVSRLVDRASARALLVRRERSDDGRVVVVELTPEGDRLAKRFLAELESQSAELRKRWSTKRQDAAAETINEIANALEVGVNAEGVSREPVPANGT